MAPAPPLVRIDDAHRDLDDRQSGGDRAQDDFGFEGISLGTGSERQRFGHGIAAQPALRVSKAPSGEERHEQVGDPVPQSVGAWRASPPQVAHAQRERSSVVRSGRAFEHRARGATRVLSICIGRDGHVEAAERGLRQPRLDRGPLSAVLGVANDAGTVCTGSVLCSVSGPVINDDDGEAKAREKIVQYVIYGVGRVECRHDHARFCADGLRHVPGKLRLLLELVKGYSVCVRLVIEGRHKGVSKSGFMRRARAMMRELQLADYEVSILLTGDNQIKILNGIYRKKNRPTDVLAFAQREGKFNDLAGRLLGDVVISIPTARRQAEERGTRLTSELTALLAHGLLHLLGWDHDTPTKDRKMRRETGRLCRAASVAAGRRGAR